MAKKDELTKRYEAARQGVLRRRLVDLPVEAIDRILVRIEEDRLEVVERMESMHQRAEACLHEGDLGGFHDIKSKVVELVAEHDGLKEQTKQVADVRQERILNDKLIGKLGSVRRLFVYDTVIMSLIVMVVALLITMEVVQFDHDTIVTMEIVDIGACFVFLGDFFWRLYLSEQRGWYWRRYWLDFVTSIPMPSAQALRLGRMVRLARLIRIAQLARMFRIVLFFWRGMDKLAATFDVKMMRRSMKFLIIFLLIGSFGIWWAEGVDNNAPEGVETFGQSLWWSFTTVVTGGFGDIHNPQTMTGRVLTVILIVAGMVVVGIFTATLTSLLVRENDASGAISDLEERMLAELAKLKPREPDDAE